MRTFKRDKLSLLWLASFNKLEYSRYSAKRCRKLKGSQYTIGIVIRVKSEKKIL